MTYEQLAKLLARDDIDNIDDATERYPDIDRDALQAGLEILGKETKERKSKEKQEEKTRRATAKQEQANMRYETVVNMRYKQMGFPSASERRIIRASPKSASVYRVERYPNGQIKTFELLNAPKKKVVRN